MDPEIEEFFLHFLAKNKYPEIKTQINENHFFTKEFQLITASVKDLEANKNKSAQDKFILALNYFGLGSGVDLARAYFWSKQLNDLPSVILHILIQLRQDHSRNNYRKFMSEYHILLEKLPKINFNYEKLRYRFLKLLAGWVQDHGELELAEDFNYLSELESDGQVNYSMKLDKLINRWISLNFKLEFYLIRGITRSHPKIDYLCGK